MRRDTEPIRLPTWTTVLADYRHALDAYRADPGSLPRTAFLDRAVIRLQEAVRQPGLFKLGLVALTEGAIRELVGGQHLAEEFLLRHKHGDFGLMVPDDVQTNRFAIDHGHRITSRYETRAGGELWVVTDGQRLATHLFERREH